MPIGCAAWPPPGSELQHGEGPWWCSEPVASACWATSGNNGCCGTGMSRCPALPSGVQSKPGTGPDQRAPGSLVIRCSSALHGRETLTWLSERLFSQLFGITLMPMVPRIWGLGQAGPGFRPSPHQVAPRSSDPGRFVEARSEAAGFRDPGPGIRLEWAENLCTTQLWPAIQLGLSSGS